MKIRKKISATRYITLTAQVALSTSLAICKRMKITDKADDRTTLNTINKSYKEPSPLNEKQNNSTLKNIRPRTEINYDTNEAGLGVGAQLK